MDYRARSDIPKKKTEEADLKEIKALDKMIAEQLPTMPTASCVQLSHRSLDVPREQRWTVPFVVTRTRRRMPSGSR